MRAVIAFIRAYPRRSLIVLVALVVAGTLEGVSMTALLPVLSVALDHGTTDENGVSGIAMKLVRGIGLEPTISSLLGLIVVGVTATSAVALLARREIGYTVAQVATDLRLQLLRSLVAARWEYYLRQPVGKLSNAMSGEASAASQAYLSATTMLTSAIQAVAYSAVAFAVSWKATAAYVVASAVIAVAMHSTVRLAKRAGKRSTKVMTQLMTGLYDTLQSVKPLKAMGRENLADGVLAAQTLELNAATRRLVVAREGRKAIQQPIVAIMMAAGTWVGVVLWNLPMSTVLVLMILLSRVLFNFGKVQSDYQDLVGYESFYWSLRRTLDEAALEVEQLGGTVPPTLERELAIEHVEFAYSGVPVLRDCSLQIPVGSFASIVGPSGAGKTTLIDLVVGLVRPQRGRVLLDGVDLEEVELHAWRRMIGYVPQENLLLHDTIARNVTLGDAEVGPADVEYALRAAGAWPFIASLPEGVHTVVGERGARFSGGQRQRIMIARALAHRPHLLILDEATASLDPATEAAVCETLARLRGEMTILAISHQRALVDAADRVYRIDKGGVTLEIDRGAASAPAAVGASAGSPANRAVR
ncbi:MAG TPA: ABC transporter ATP-binding protein [Myxococcota bacterium]|nr:ABC transporter ATP-binding protein [Myxococcota bacterium]